MTMQIHRARKRPVVIEVVLLSEDNAAEVAEWCGGRLCTADDIDLVAVMAREPVAGAAPAGSVYISTLEGPHVARPGDWVAKGVKGEFYPIKPDIFSETYDLADA